MEEFIKLIYFERKFVLIFERKVKDFFKIL